MRRVVASMHDIDEEVLFTPFVEVFGERAGLAEGGAEDVARAEDGFVDYVEGGGCVAGECKCEEVNCENMTD